MTTIFSADEIFEMAEQLERNGAGFYRKAAKGMPDKNMKNLLGELADMEVEHEKTFAAMRAELIGSDQLPDVFDPNDEVGLYLQALADGKVFDTKTDPSKQLTGKETPQDILNTAIGLEKESIVFYLGLEEYVPVESGKEKVRAIIKQEMSHVALLNDKLKVLEQ